MPRPGTPDFDCLERCYAVRENWPYPVFEECMVHRKIIEIYVLIRLGRQAANKALSLRPEPQAGGIDHQWAIWNVALAVKYKYTALARLHRNVDACPGTQPPGVSTGRIHQVAARYLRLVGKRDTTDLLAG